MTRENDMMFSTKSHDNDVSDENCALRFGASWWFGKCHNALLTGKYGRNHSHAEGVTWRYPWGYDKFARYATMMIRSNV